MSWLRGGKSSCWPAWRQVEEKECLPVADCVYPVMRFIHSLAKESCRTVCPVGIPETLPKKHHAPILSPSSTASMLLRYCSRHYFQDGNYRYLRQSLQCQLAGSHRNWSWSTSRFQLPFAPANTPTTPLGLLTVEPTWQPSKVHIIVFLLPHFPLLSSLYPSKL
jgi:hypothetical protein